MAVIFFSEDAVLYCKMIVSSTKNVNVELLVLKKCYFSKSRKNFHPKEY